MPDSQVRLQEVTRRYDADVMALDRVTLDIAKGEWLSIMGPSGSGKTTLLNLLGCMDSPSSGQIFIDGVDITRFNATELTQFRREKIGLVFQQFHLVKHLTALENVMLAQYFHSMVDEREARAALQRVGLGERMAHLPSQLSGGEQQRVCIARALINEPAIILADEPTGNLDEKNEALVLELFNELHRSGHTLIVVTHDITVGKLGDRRIQLEHGKVVGSYRSDYGLQPSALLPPSETEELRDEILEQMWVLREDGALTVSELSKLAVFADGAFVRNMAERQLIQVSGDAIRFLPDGERRAYEIVRRHRLAEKLFQDTLKMDDATAEALACRFEHILEPTVTDSICSFLSHPRQCPHGKEIPRGSCCESSH